MLNKQIASLFICLIPRCLSTRSSLNRFFLSEWVQVGRERTVQDGGFDMTHILPKRNVLQVGGCGFRDCQADMAMRFGAVSFSCEIMERRMKDYASV